MHTQIPAIIVVTFNRPNSLKRVLASLKAASYPKNENVPLVISIDYQDSNSHSEVVKIAHEFEWHYGRKEVIEHKENMGLRKHVISCGNLVRSYDSIIMLEDDIYVSPKFYSYALNSLEFYGDKNYIGGISLYKHEKNPNNNRPFQPLPNNFDVFFLQFAQSWGQCWSRTMWEEFINWYNNNIEWEKDDVDLPSFVLGWPASSWLKYYIKYLAVTNKYFIYPNNSFSTNFHDAGTHNKDDANNYCQVHLDVLSDSKMRFPKINEAVCYDVYFELQNIHNYIPASKIKWEFDVCVDLFATKKNIRKNKYWISTAILPYKIIKKYGLNLRPQDVNIVLNNEGEGIYLYDTSQYQNKKLKSNIETIVNYDYSISLRKILILLKIKLLNKLK